MHPAAVVTFNLFWDFDLQGFDFTASRNLAVPRVIERRWPTDWYFILNLYGVDRGNSAM